jgi:hypothetical protein
VAGGRISATQCQQILPRFKARYDKKYVVAFPMKRVPFWLVIVPGDHWTTIADADFLACYRPSNKESRNTMSLFEKRRASQGLTPVGPAA